MNGIHMRRFRNIPPLQYLLGFEAAARLESYSKAAAELGLSQSAVSHEMRLLEERLGQPLFLRHGRSIKLTDAGRDYQRTVLQSLEHLEGGYQRLEPYRKPGSVVIYCEADFASRWLLPRLADLKREVPACEPWIDTSGKVIDFESLECSIAIVRSTTTEPQRPSQVLFEDVLVPAASRQTRFGVFRKSADILNHPLIHDERPEGWHEWFENAGVKTEDLSAGLDFNDREMALRAAELGYGIALCTRQLVGVSGSLTQVSPIELATGHTWQAQSTATELADKITHQVWHWLSAKTKERAK